MKLTRHDPIRRRRSPISTLLIIAVLAFLGLFAVAWVRGGEKPVQTVELPIPANQLGH